MAAPGGQNNADRPTVVLGAGTVPGAACSRRSLCFDLPMAACPLPGLVAMGRS